MAKFIMNTSIVPNNGTFTLATIDEDEAKKWVANGDWTSAVGHPGTAEVMSSLLGTEISPNRIQVTFEVGDEALVFKLDCRLPEGKVLNAEELKGLPFSWKLLRRIA
jgi:hypothetical protein